ncbi:MAG: Ldh family oxidoreductase [Desulfamplus sp.]|nr:Ldh family oxidoreductase [Desulfamplus sp.]
MIYLNHLRFKEAIVSILMDITVSELAAVHVAESLVTTSLRGVDSHGVNLFPHYVRAVKAGRINAWPKMSFKQTGHSTSKLDADHAFGHYAGSVAMGEAIKLAKQSGVGAVSVSNSTHFGAAAYFALQAADHDCIGLAFTNADALVKAYGAKEAFFGTNPICFTVPLANEEPFCLDMATSLVSWNKVLSFRRHNENIASDWAFDANGRSVDDPNRAVSLNPAGGYKGFGLGMMVDVLCALLSGGPISKDILPMFNSPIEERRKISHFFMALLISNFGDPVIFRSTMQDMVDRIRAMDAVDTKIPVMVPGDPEKFLYEERLKSGIPVEEKVFEELIALNGLFSNLVLK